MFAKKGGRRRNEQRTNTERIILTTCEMRKLKIYSYLAFHDGPALGCQKLPGDSFAAAWATVLGAAWGGFLGLLEWQVPGGSRVEVIEAFGGSHCVALGKVRVRAPRLSRKGLITARAVWKLSLPKVYQDWLARPSKST